MITNYNTFSKCALFVNMITKLVFAEIDDKDIAINDLAENLPDELHHF